MQKVIPVDEAQFELIVAESYFNGNGNTNNERRKKVITTIHEIIDNELTEKQREYITAYYINGEKQQAIADRYGVHNSTVSRTIQTGMRKLQKIGRYINLR